MTASAERLAATRRQSLLGFLVCYVVWTVWLLGRTGSPSLSAHPRIRVAGAIVAIIACVGWTTQLVRLLLIGAKLRADPRLVSALYDERIRMARYRLGAITLAIVMLLQIAFVAASGALGLAASWVGLMTILTFVAMVAGGLWLIERP